jgi:hypothetical protein
VSAVPAWLTPRRAAIAAGLAVGALYLAALPGPLRLDTDSAWLLRLGASLADGTGLHPPDSQSFPPGYPVIVAALDVAGVAGPVGFMLVGVVSLAVALAAAASVLHEGLRLSRAEVTVVLLLTTLSVYTVKYTTLPLTELPFFAVTALAVAALTRFRGGRSPAWFVAAVVLAGIACTIRTAGIALVLAFVLAFPGVRARAVALVVAGAGALAAIAVAPYYLESLVNHWQDEPLRNAWREPWWFLRSAGAVGSNVPTSWWSRDVSAPVTAAAGVALLAVVAWAFWARRRSLGPVDGWVAGTLGIVFLFPTEHPRFYLPVLPFLVGYCALAARRAPRAAIACASAFAAVGLYGLVVSTSLSWSGTDFPERYASGRLAPTYRTAWGLARPGDEADIDTRVLWALRRYDPDPPRLR